MVLGSELTHAHRASVHSAITSPVDGDLTLAGLHRCLCGDPALFNLFGTLTQRYLTRIQALLTDLGDRHWQLARGVDPLVVSFSDLQNAGFGGLGHHGIRSYPVPEAAPLALMILARAGLAQRTMEIEAASK
jgi:hypothetical protein